MENIDWTRFTLKIPVKASLHILYEAWTKPLELEKWFLREADYSDAKGNATAKNVFAGAGSSYAWQWYSYDMTENGKINEANGKDHVQFTFAGKCLVDVKFSQRDSDVVVELTQKNIPTDDDSKVNIRLGCHTGWSFFLANLKSVYEGGIDLRNKDNDLHGMVNN